MSRIIAGSRGGRRIATPPGDRTRPTTDRVREALFSAIAAWAGTAAAPAEQSLAGLAFCDLYAGSGAVGLEAASRGARPVLLVERDPRTAQLTKDNARALALEVDLVISSVEQVLRRRPARPFDVVFADPPYEMETRIVSGQLEQLVVNEWVGSSSLIVVERSRRTADLIWPEIAAHRWSRAYGETILHFGVARAGCRRPRTRIALLGPIRARCSRRRSAGGTDETHREDSGIYETVVSSDPTKTAAPSEHRSERSEPSDTASGASNRAVE